MEPNWDALSAKLEQMAVEFKKRDQWALISNHDADGLSSAAIIATVMNRLGMSYQTLILKQLYPEHVEQIKAMGPNYFFCDFGSGQLNFLRETFGENFFVLDHHQPLPVLHELHCNPLLFGFNGGTELSAAGLCYLFSKTVDPKNQDLAYLGVVGAMGDMQDGEGKLIGLNTKVADDGIQAGVLDRKIDLRLYGRISRPLTQFLSFATSPVLPQLTANEPNCRSFLENLKIPLQDGAHYRSYEELSSEEKKRLSSALILHLYSHDVSEWKIKELIGEVYSISIEPTDSPLRDAKEFGTVLNATGRWKKSDIGLAVAMGNRGDAYHTALAMLTNHRRELRNGIEYMQQKGVEEHKWFYFFDAENTIPDSIIGIVAGMMYGSGSIGFEKAIIAFSRYEDGSIKASGRATKELVRRGLNLGKAFRVICNELGEGNEGGGHAIAAGVKIEAKNKELFLALLDDQIAKQLTGLGAQSSSPQGLKTTGNIIGSDE
ncbi:MAG: DHH family phosphoesterase [Candidatus Diapherotrites archaeon]|uniref:DHH family phosphoesterase n=1 Tax=Candidatus Iainarchaeum sp. TaxID=3101447 RepID=A0A8T4LH05_9ARCH|nr:DHH family phosphoesterase [Candidatus Diapherotrites archaeon]